MSVDSFIQTRLSVDTTSDHSNQPLLHPSLSASSDPVTDPRWQMVLPTGPGAEHAFLESIRSELTDTDRQFISSPPSTSASGPPRALGALPGPSRALSDAEDPSSSAGGFRRHSMLRNRLKHVKANSSMIKAHSRSNPTQPQAQNQNSSSSSNLNQNTVSSLSSASSHHANNYSSDSRFSTRRPAVSSSGNPSSSIPPQSHSSQTPPLPTSPSNPQTQTLTQSRRANAPGHISVTQQRVRTMSLGGGGGGASTSVSSSTATGSTSDRDHPHLGSLRLATDELPTPNDPEYCVAFVGSKGCGKSHLIRKVIKSYPTLETTTIHSAETGVNSITVQVNISSNLKPVRILEVDNAIVAYPDNLWPQELPRVDGVLLCYDASNEDSFTRLPELLAGYHRMGVPIVIVACKSDLHKVISPSRADSCGKQYNVGLVEVSVATDQGKKRIRDCFHWEIKAIGRHRRAGGSAAGIYRNPASPDILQTSRPPWDGSRVTPSLTKNSSSSSIAVRPLNNSAPVLPMLDNYTLSTSTAPSTARTSSDSVAIAPNASSASRPRSPSAPSSPRQPGFGLGFQDETTAEPKATASASAGAGDTDGPSLVNTNGNINATIPPSGVSGPSELPRNASVSSIQQNNAPPHAAAAEVGPNPDAARNQRESAPLQWATLDEILDKLLFVAVSGDDPLFIQHFFLTYRRFASPRSVLLGMQKRMRQLGQENRDPLLAKFAQMRICNLLSQWKDNYPTDFGAPGTHGALNALLKQIVSNVHLVHYGSDLLPFLDEVPNLVDRESTWCKKEDVGVESDEGEPDVDTEDEIVLPTLDDEDETYMGKGKAFERRTPVSSNPQPPNRSTITVDRPYPAKASSSAPNVATTSMPHVPPMPSQPIHRNPVSTTYGQQQEGVITFDRPTPRTARVNSKDLLRVANSILQTETVHVAQEVTRRMLIHFKKIEARDWLRRTLSKEGYDKENDPIGQLGRLFNYLCCWVSAMIVVFDTPRNRARMIEKFIGIATSLRRQNNYMGMKAFIAGINSVRGNDDEELTQLLSTKQNWKQFQSLHLLLGSTRMGQTYRTALKHTVGPAIPDLERHGSDLLRANEGNLDYKPQDPNLIHWGKFTIMGKLVGTVTLYQNRCYTMSDYRDLEERAYISDLVFNQIVWDYDTLMNREAKALEEGMHTESSSNLVRKLIPGFKG